MKIDDNRRLNTILAQLGFASCTKSHHRIGREEEEQQQLLVILDRASSSTVSMGFSLLKKRPGSVTATTTTTTPTSTNTIQTLGGGGKASTSARLLFGSGTTATAAGADPLNNSNNNKHSRQQQQKQHMLTVADSTEGTSLEDFSLDATLLSHPFDRSNIKSNSNGSATGSNNTLSSCSMLSSSKNNGPPKLSLLPDGGQKQNTIINNTTNNNNNYTKNDERVVELLRHDLRQQSAHCTQLQASLSSLTDQMHHQQAMLQLQLEQAQHERNALLADKEMELQAYKTQFEGFLKERGEAGGSSNNNLQTEADIVARTQALLALDPVLGRGLAPLPHKGGDTTPSPSPPSATTSMAVGSEGAAVAERAPLRRHNSDIHRTARRSLDKPANGETVAAAAEKTATKYYRTIQDANTNNKDNGEVTATLNDGSVVGWPVRRRPPPPASRSVVRSHSCVARRKGKVTSRPWVPPLPPPLPTAEYSCSINETPNKEMTKIAKSIVPDARQVSPVSTLASPPMEELLAIDFSCGGEGDDIARSDDDSNGSSSNDGSVPGPNRRHRRRTFVGPTDCLHPMLLVEEYNDHDSFQQNPTKQRNCGQLALDFAKAAAALREMDDNFDNQDDANYRIITNNDSSDHANQEQPELLTSCSFVQDSVDKEDDCNKNKKASAPTSKPTAVESTISDDQQEKVQVFDPIRDIVVAPRLMASVSRRKLVTAHNSRDENQLPNNANNDDIDEGEESDEVETAVLLFGCKFMNLEEFMERRPTIAQSHHMASAMPGDAPAPTFNEDDESKAVVSTIVKVSRSLRHNRRKQKRKNDIVGKAIPTDKTSNDKEVAVVAGAFAEKDYDDDISALSYGSSDTWYTTESASVITLQNQHDTPAQRRTPRSQADRLRSRVRRTAKREASLANFVIEKVEC